jgi:hypothetical protein
MSGFVDEPKYVENITGSTTTIVYMGYAWPGTLITDKKWKIKRVTTTGILTKVEYALPLQGANTMTDYFIHSWNDRTTLTRWG